MPRWRQVYSEDEGKHVLVPVDEAAVKHDAARGIIVRGNFDAFRSPIDGSLISNHREYTDHCKKHDVVPAQEFNQEFFERKAAEREAFFKGEHSEREKLARKKEVWEIINYLERNS